VKSLQPQIVINNRLDLGKGDSDRKLLSSFADYYTPEQQLGSYDDQHPWETCMTLGTQWAWKPNDTIKSVSEVVRILANCVGGDGNLLLNVGPMPDGRIEPRQVEVLKGVGDWLRRNGESIYGTRGGPFLPGKYGLSTRNGNAIYLHILKWNDDTVTLPGLPKKVTEATLLTGGEMKFEQTETALRITVSPQYRQSSDTVVKLQLDGSAMGIAPIASEPSGS
jgi:alpha-L-fucosidase